MHDFGKFTYLDLHKTGSSYVSQFLKNCCILDQIKFSKHDWIKEDYRSDCFYFITIRHPQELWSSLYRYGLDCKGDVFNRLKQFNMLHHYKSFDTFLNFCLDEKNASLLGYDYNSEISNHIGFMSFRFLKLSLQFPMNKIYHCINTSKDFPSLESKFITNLEIKNEQLNEELLNLATVLFPHYFDDIKVREFLNSNTRINESKTSQTDVDRLNDFSLSRMFRKEWLLMSRYREIFHN